GRIIRLALIVSARSGYAKVHGRIGRGGKPMAASGGQLGGCGWCMRAFGALFALGRGRGLGMFRCREVGSRCWAGGARWSGWAMSTVDEPDEPLPPSGGQPL